MNELSSRHVKIQTSHPQLGDLEVSFLKAEFDLMLQEGLIEKTETGDYVFTDLGWQALQS